MFAVLNLILFVNTTKIVNFDEFEMESKLLVSFLDGHIRFNQRRRVNAFEFY